MLYYIGLFYESACQQRGYSGKRDNYFTIETKVFYKGKYVDSNCRLAENVSLYILIEI